MKWAKQYDILHEALSQYPCQQLGVVDTPPEYAQMFNQYQQEVFDDNLVITEENGLEKKPKEKQKRKQSQKQTEKTNRKSK